MNICLTKKIPAESHLVLLGRKKNDFSEFLKTVAEKKFLEESIKNKDISIHPQG